MALTPSAGARVSSVLVMADDPGSSRVSPEGHGSLKVRLLRGQSSIYFPTIVV